MHICELQRDKPQAHAGLNVIICLGLFKTEAIQLQLSRRIGLIGGIELNLKVPSFIDIFGLLV